jgi:hypothetical protein
MIYDHGRHSLACYNPYTVAHLACASCIGSARVLLNSCLINLATDLDFSDTTFQGLPADGIRPGTVVQCPEARFYPTANGPPS